MEKSIMQTETATDSLFGEIISSYSRAQAIEDGVLVDVSDTSREAGISFPVAMTRAVWDQYVAVPRGVPPSRRSWTPLGHLLDASPCCKTRRLYHQVHCIR
jgi:hypothetical protein